MTIADIDQDVTCKMALDLVVSGRPALMRSATDIVSPIRDWFKMERVATLGDMSPAVPLYFDSWLFETLSTIESHRNLSDGWDGDKATAPTKSALDAAELLSAYLAPVDEARRPRLCIDVLGRPTFATSDDGFYLHLTIDHRGALTWYAVVGKDEFFADDVAFDGRQLPDSLGLLLAPAV